MKRFLLAFSALFALQVSAQTTALDCAGNRYHQAIFTTSTKTANVQYGTNFKQDGTTPENLLLDVYTPDGDADTDRPLILLAHGGSFIGGSKADVEAQCRILASMGYVAVSMDYRLLSLNAQVFLNKEIEFQYEVIRAIHDMRAAIRFFRKSAANGNPYGINENLIIVGGFSAGAIMADHVAYLNKVSEIPTHLVTYMNAQGGLEGNSGNAGFSSVPQLVLSWCGAIMDTTWMSAGDQPYAGMHNLSDPVVPNLSGYPNPGFEIQVTLQGDSLMYKRALNQGIESVYKSYPGNQHCDFPAGSDQLFIDFLHNQLCVQGLAIANNPKSVLFSVYPNPAEEAFFIDIPSNEWEWTVSITNMLGQTIYTETIADNQNRISVNSTNFSEGVYFVKLVSTDGKEATKKVVVR